MALPFSAAIKAQVTQSLVATLLERGGYRVTRLGIEELFGEVKHLDLPQYLSLNLPKPLRSLPDLLVADRDMNKAFLVEVKYRREFTDRACEHLRRELTSQRRHWPESYAVILIGEPFVRGGRFHQDYIRVVPPGRESELLHHSAEGQIPESLTGPEQRWDSLPMLHNVFQAFYTESSALQDYERFLAGVLARLAQL